MILVIGGTGLVGSHLLYQLTQQNEVVKAIYRDSKSLYLVKKVFSYYTKDVVTCFSKIEWIQADITNITSLYKPFEKVNKVYHVAALISFNPKAYRKMRQVNIEGTANVVNFCISNKIEKLCFVSSIAVLGENVTKTITDEENEWNPNVSNHGYSITKYGAEIEVWRASQEGVDVVIVNPGVILGSGFWKSGSGVLFTKIKSGFKFYTTGSTGFVGVQDVVKSMILLMESTIKNERFVLVSENKTFQELFYLISDAFKVERPKINVSAFWLSILWRLDSFITFLSGKKRALTKHSAKSLTTKATYSSEKIIKNLDFEFTPITSVVAATCQDFLN